MDFTAKFEGFDELSKQLRTRLPKAVAEGSAQVITKLGLEAEKNAKALVPVDSGNLKDTIELRVSRNPKEIGAVVWVGGDTADDKAKAYSVEFGRQQGNRGTTAEEPFVRPAQRIAAKKLPPALKRVINKAIRDTTK